MSGDRRAIGEALNRLAFVADLLDDDTVDAKACSGLAWAVRSLEGDVTLARLATLDGVSVPILAVVDDVVHDRVPPLLSALEQRVPQGLLEIRRLKGLGPKKIRALWQQLDITSVGELEYACKENRLVELKGFGKKTQESVVAQITALRAQAGLLRLDHADGVAALVAAVLGAGALIVGDLRRRTEVVAEVPFVTTASVDITREALAIAARQLGGAATNDDGDDAAPASSPGSSVVVDGDRLRVRAGGTEVQVRANVPATKLGAALIAETGAAAHVEALRARAKERGLVFDDVTGDEAAVYDALGVRFVAPERRESGVALVEKGTARPRLVRRADLRGSLHNHTTASDGDASMAEMRAAAGERGLAYLAITDHSQSAVYAKGLAAASLSRQKDEARALNASEGCTVLCGIESDILKDGALDYPDDVLRGLEIVVASVHARFGQKGPDLTARMVAAARNRYADIVGHPTGRLLLGRAPSEYDVSALIEVCAMSGCALELNANPARLDLNERHLAEAKERGVIISIAADAHATDELDYLDYGVAIARRAGLTPEDVLNTRSLDEVRGWLGARRARAAARAE